MPQPCAASNNRPPCAAHSSLLTLCAARSSLPVRVIRCHLSFTCPSRSLPFSLACSRACSLPPLPPHAVASDRIASGRSCFSAPTQRSSLTSTGPLWRHFLPSDPTAPRGARSALSSAHTALLPHRPRNGPPTIGGGEIAATRPSRRQRVRHGTVGWGTTTCTRCPRYATSSSDEATPPSFLCCRRSPRTIPTWAVARTHRRRAQMAHAPPLASRVRRRHESSPPTCGSCTAWTGGSVRSISC